MVLVMTFKRLIMQHTKANTNCSYGSAIDKYCNRSRYDAEVQSVANAEANGAVSAFAQYTK